MKTVLGLLFSILGIGASLVTVTNGDYRGCLMVSLLCSVVSTVCLFKSWKEFTLGGRSAIALGLVLNFLILLDFIKRFPFAFFR